jgi:signal transduction histidine kinase
MLIAAGQCPPELLHSKPPSTTDAVGIGRQQYEQRYIQFSSGKHHFPTLSYAQVLEGHYLPDTFRDKLVLVGATAAGLADSVPTPISGLREPTPGVEFLANTIVSMREQTLIRPSAKWLTIALTGVLTLLPLLWLPRASPQAGLLLTLSYGLSVLVLGMMLPLLIQQWLPLSAALIGILSAYPLWALRKLQSATRFMDQELARLGQELAKWAAQEDNNTHPDPIQNRILHIQKATDRLVALENQQRETLACISHDIRSPIASAAMQVKQELGEHNPVYRQLSKVLHWTEDFLQTSRAHMLDPASFASLDIIDLLHQVIDEFYPLAQARQIGIDAQLPEDPQWVQGHFDSLSRAMANLLSNAIKFSPQHQRIGITAHCTGAHIHVTVRNQGPTIPPDQIEHIFKRFGQAHAEHTRQHDGVGLGLYYVQTVAEKHGATVHVSSQSGTTEFTMILRLSPAWTKG